jgi:hypothetical protein
VTKFILLLVCHKISDQAHAAVECARALSLAVRAEELCLGHDPVYELTPETREKLCSAVEEYRESCLTDLSLRLGVLDRMKSILYVAPVTNHSKEVK